MNKISRRKLIKAGLAATAGVAGLGVAARLAEKYGLVPPITAESTAWAKR